MKLLTFDPRKKEQVLSGVYENGVFYRKVNASHFMRVEQGYGIQEDVVLKLQELGCKTVIMDAGINLYEIPFSSWLDSEPKDYGNGLQRFVSIRKTQKTKNQPMLI